MKYFVTVKETFRTMYAVEADSPAQAIECVRNLEGAEVVGSEFSHINNIDDDSAFEVECLDPPTVDENYSEDYWTQREREEGQSQS